MPSPTITNAYITTARAALNVNGSYGPPTPTGYGPIPCHIMFDLIRNYAVQADSNVIEQFFEARVDQAADVGIGDVIVSITLLDGKTPWPGDVNLFGNRKATYTWSIWNELPATPMGLPQRVLYIKRTWGGGPTTL